MQASVGGLRIKVVDFSRQGLFKHRLDTYEFLDNQ